MKLEYNHIPSTHKLVTSWEIPIMTKSENQYEAYDSVTPHGGK